MNDIVDAWSWIEQHPEALWLGSALVAVAVLSFVAVKVYGSMRGKDFDAKATIAFATVQVGVAIVMVTGTYEFFRADRFLSMPVAEAAGAAAIIEAAAWVCVGMIWAHINGTHLDSVTGQMVPNVGTGPGGYGFGIVSTGGGLLAIIGSAGIGAATGRAIIVGIGVTLWWMRILSKVRRKDKPGKFMFSPYRLARRWGWIQVTDDDVTDDSREWRVRKLAKAMRLAAHPWPLFAWRGKLILTRLTDGETAGVLADAQDRYAVGYVVREQVNPTSPEMAAVIARARRALAPAEPPPDVDESDLVQEPVVVESTVGDPLPAPLTAEDMGAIMERLLTGLLENLPIAQAAPAPPVKTPAVQPPRVAGSAGRWPDSEENERTVKWLLEEYSAGRSPSLMEIRRYGGSAEKPRSENWAKARRDTALARVPVEGE